MNIYKAKGQQNFNKPSSQSFIQTRVLSQGKRNYEWKWKEWPPRGNYFEATNAILDVETL